MNKMEDFFNASRLSELMHKQRRKDHVACKVLCIIAALVGIAAIVFCVCKYISPKFKDKCLDDFDDAFEDEMEDDFFEDDDDVVENA